MLWVVVFCIKNVITTKDKAPLGAIFDNLSVTFLVAIVIRLRLLRKLGDE